jgi:hypothetical protein
MLARSHRCQSFKLCVKPQLEDHRVVHFGNAAFDPLEVSRQGEPGGERHILEGLEPDFVPEQLPRQVGSQVARLLEPLHPEAEAVALAARSCMSPTLARRWPLPK